MNYDSKVDLVVHVLVIFPLSLLLMLFGGSSQADVWSQATNPWFILSVVVISAALLAAEMIGEALLGKA